MPRLIRDGQTLKASKDWICFPFSCRSFKKLRLHISYRTQKTLFDIKLDLIYFQSFLMNIDDDKDCCLLFISNEFCSHNFHNSFILWTFAVHSYFLALTRFYNNLKQFQIMYYLYQRGISVYEQLHMLSHP